MNKNDLIAHVERSTGLRRAEATKAVDAVLDGIQSSLQSGDDVRLVGFGTFTVAERAASEGRNPRTGERISIAASRQPKFKAGKALKDAINPGGNGGGGGAGGGAGGGRGGAGGGRGGGGRGGAGSR